MPSSTLLILALLFVIPSTLKCMSCPRVVNGRVPHVLCKDVGALLLDCDGTIAETERELTLAQFNAAFASVPELRTVVWSSDEYGELLKVGASQARITSFFNQPGWPSTITTEENRIDYAEFLKRRKDEMLEVIWARGSIKLLPGIARLIDEAFAHDVKVAVVSNSNLEPVTKICSALLGVERVSRMTILTGDMSEFKKHKKPNPTMYARASEMMGLPPSRCVVVEASFVGLTAPNWPAVTCMVKPSF